MNSEFIEMKYKIVGGINLLKNNLKLITVIKKYYR